MKRLSEVRRFRLILPASLVTLSAIMLYVGRWQWEYWKYGPEPLKLTVCNALNFPARVVKVLVMELLHKLLRGIAPPPSWETWSPLEYQAEPLLFLLLIGVLWYVIGLEIDSRRRGKRAIVPSRPWLRLCVAFMLIGIGGFFGLIAVEFWKLFLRDAPIHLIARRELLNAISCSIWALLLLVAYGWDFARGVRAIAQARSQAKSSLGTTS